jgi:biopolymer transport protein TolR
MVSDINVTPFVDVMLVLLIIFMVAAPMMIQGINVQLPTATARPLPTETERIVVSITADGKAHVDDTGIEIEMLGTTLSALQAGFPEKRGVLLRADRKVEYGVVAQVMGALREAGIEQIGMVTEPVNSQAPSVSPQPPTPATGQGIEE